MAIDGNTIMVYAMIVIIMVVIIIIVIAMYGTKKHSEGFNNFAIGVRPESLTQKYNVIGDTIQTSSQNVNIIGDGVSNHAYEIKFPAMLRTYVIKQIYVTGLMPTNTKFRIAVRNSSEQSIRYVGFSTGNDILGVKLSTTVDENSAQFTRITTGQSSSSGFIIDDVTDIYGNNMIGDTILLFTSNEIRDLSDQGYKPRVFVTGYPDGEKFDLTYIQQNSSNITTTKDRPVIADREFISELDDIRVPYIVTKITLDANNLLAVENNAQIHSEKSTNMNNINGIAWRRVREGDRIAVLFKNNYTNNTILYPGPVEGQFIFNLAAPTLYFNQTLVANTIILKVFPQPVEDSFGGMIDMEPFVIEDKLIREMRGYTASIDDINRFKLQYNITDIRGSINPDDVCPTMDKFMSDQINAEIILETLEYQDRINREKRKLISHKDNLLRINEQSEDIVRLEAMINKLESISKDRQHRTDAANTLHFTKQLEEAMILRERLDNRLSTQKANTFNTSVNVKHPFDLTPDDDMRL